MQNKPAYGLACFHQWFPKEISPKMAFLNQAVGRPGFMKHSPSQDQTRFRHQSLVEQIADHLRALLLQKKWAEHLPSERALSHSMKASRPIVRRAIHLLAKEGLVQTVQGHPARITLSPTGTTGTNPPRQKRVALLFGDSLHAVAQWPITAIGEIRKQLYEHGFEFELIPDPRLLKTRSHTFFNQLVKRHPADFWILAGISHLGQNWFQQHQLDAIVMGNPFPDIRLASVNDDLKSATRHAAGVLLGLGHERITFLMRRVGSAGEDAEEIGFMEAFRSRSSTCPRVLRHNGEVEAIRARLEHLFRLPYPPTGLLVSHAMDLLVVSMWLLEKAISVPRQVSLVSLQWESFLERIRPLPAWYYTDPKKHAAQICRRIIHHAPNVPSVRLIPRFCKNASVAPPPDQYQ